MKILLTVKDNLNIYNDKYVKIGDENLWKIYIEK